MKKFLVGVVVGIVLATVGFTGVFRVLDRGVDTVKEQTYKLSR